MAYQSELFIVLASAGFLFPSLESSSSYRWPLANYTGGAETDHGGGNVGKAGCTVTSGPQYAVLPYHSMLFDGQASSYVELDIGSETAVTDWTFIMFIYISDLAGGTLLHFLYDGPSDSSSTLYSDEILLGFNQIHIMLSISGPDGEDFGTVAVEHGFTTENWIWLLVSHQASNGNILIRTFDTVLYESDLAADNVIFHQPAKVKLGGSYGENAMQFTGSIVCLGLYDYPLSYNELKMGLYHCKPMYWNTIPASIELPVPSCPEYRGYFTIVSKDARPYSSFGPVYTIQVRTLSECADTCLKEVFCESIAYKRITEECVIYNGVFDTNLKPEIGTNYYKRKDRCCSQ